MEQANSKVILTSFWAAQKLQGIPTFSIAQVMPDFAEESGMGVLPFLAPTSEMRRDLRATGKDGSLGITTLITLRRAVVNAAFKGVLSNSDMSEADLLRLAQDVAPRAIDMHQLQVSLDQYRSLLREQMQDVKRRLMAAAASGDATLTPYQRQTALVDQLHSSIIDQWESMLGKGRTRQSRVEREEVFTNAYLALLEGRRAMVADWVESLSGPAALCCWETGDERFCHRLILGQWLNANYPGLTVTLEDLAASLTEDEGEESSIEDRSLTNLWTPSFVPPSNPPVPKAIETEDYSMLPATQFAPEDAMTPFGRSQEIAEMGDLYADWEAKALGSSSDDADAVGFEDRDRGYGRHLIEVGGEPEPRPALSLSAEEQTAMEHTLQMYQETSLDYLDYELVITILATALPHRMEDIMAYEEEHLQWAARERERAQRLALDLVQERLHQPGTNAARYGRAHNPVLRKVVTKALAAPDMTHPELALAGSLFMDAPAAMGDDTPETVAEWISQTAADPELFTELTANPDAPAPYNGIGLTHETLLPTGDLTKLWNSVKLALTKEAKSALWSGTAEDQLAAAINKIAEERQLDSVELRQLLEPQIIAEWRKRETLYTAVAVAFVTGTHNGPAWQTRIRVANRANWIQPWVQKVAAVAFIVQNAPHWKRRALEFGGITPTQAQEIVHSMDSFEREFIRRRIHCVFGFMSTRFGEMRITHAMPLGIAVRRCWELAQHRRSETREAVSA